MQSEGGNIILTKESALVSSYSDEYDSFIESKDILDSIVKSAGGSVWDNITDILKVKIVGAKEYLGYTLPLLIVTISVLLIDIAIRRLQLSSFFRLFNNKASYSLSKVKEAFKMPEKSKEYKPVRTADVIKNNKNNVTSTENTVKEKPPEKKQESSVSSLLEAKEAKSRKKL